MSLYINLVQKKLRNNTNLPDVCIVLVTDIINDLQELVQLIVDCEPLLNQYDKTLQLIIDRYPNKQHIHNDIKIFGKLIVLESTFGSQTFKNLFKTPDGKNALGYHQSPRKVKRDHVIIQDIIEIPKRKLELAIKIGVDQMMIRYAKHLHNILIRPIICKKRSKHKDLPGYGSLHGLEYNDKYVKENALFINIVSECPMKNHILESILIGIYGKAMAINSLFNFKIY